MTELVKAHNLVKHFETPAGLVRAVDDVSFAIEAGRTVGLVGESGCGKSTIGRTILKLIEPNGGQLFFDGQDIFQLPRKERQALRREMGMVFQDPYSSLNPRLKVLGLVGEPLKTHTDLRGTRLKDRVVELLALVGLKPEHLNRFPHQFSGGQRQRLAIARSLALDPRFLIFDEPTSALDVSVQAQVLNLIGRLQRDRNLTNLFITHDLHVVYHIADTIMVMYLGRLVEAGPVEVIFDRPLHPYTLGLIEAAPSADPRQRGRRMLLEGDVPSPVNPPPGCRFTTRCRWAEEVCRLEVPKMRPVEGRLVACHRAPLSME